MATETPNAKSQQFVCGICVDTYVTPRYLPTCGHTFCENCLLTFATNLQQQGRKPECPTCRKPQRIPEDDTVTLEWIQTFPLNSVIIKMMKSSSESVDQKTAKAAIRRNCDPCSERGETVTGLKLCLDCHEVYCKSCTDSHRAFKMSRNHKLIDATEVEAESNRTDFFASFSQCMKHPEKELEFYCSLHDTVFCAVCCLTDHDKECDTVELAKHETDAAKLREESDKLATQLRAALDDLTMFKTLKEKNKNDLKGKLKEIREEIEQIREQVVTLFDNVVRHVSEVTKKIELENDDRLDEEISEVSKLKELTEEKVAVLGKGMQHGSEKHQFISAHLMKKTVERN